MIETRKRSWKGSLLRLVLLLPALFWACSGVINLGDSDGHHDDRDGEEEGEPEEFEAEGPPEDVQPEGEMEDGPNCLVDNSMPVDDDALCPDTARIVGTHDIEGGGHGIFVQGDCAFITAYASNLLIVDIRDPENPSLLSSLEVRPHVGDIFVSGPMVFLAAGLGGLCLVDISDIRNPTLRSCYEHEHEGGIGEIFSRDGYAYASNYGATSGGLFHIFDVSDPDNPREVAVYDTPGLAPGLFISGDYAFIADRSSLEILSLEDISSPRTVGSYESEVGIDLVRVQGDYAYALDAGGVRGTLMIIDVSNVSNPWMVGSIEREGGLYNLDVQGKYAYVAYADFPGGIYIIDVENPESPQQAGFVPLSLATDVFVRGGYAYISGGTTFGDGPGVGTMGVASLFCED